MSNDTDRGDGDSDSIDGDGGKPGENVQENVQESIEMGRQRLEEEADRAVDTFDEGVVDLLSWVLDTETRARIYVYLRKHPDSTSEEIAEGTGLYPSTVREALAELTEEGKVTRQKRESEGAGNNPYEYEAIAPSDLVGGVVADVQNELNTVFNLDNYLGTGEETAEERQPINITVEDEAVDDDAGEESGDRVEPEGSADDVARDGSVADDADEGDADDVDADGSVDVDDEE
jgi:predicted transcriptional regulator